MRRSATAVPGLKRYDLQPSRSFVSGAGLELPSGPKVSRAVQLQGGPRQAGQRLAASVSLVATPIF